MCFFACVCKEAEACVSFGMRRSACDSSLTVVVLLLGFADTTHGSQKRTSLTRDSSSRFNTGEKEVDFGRGRTASQFSHGLIWVWEEGHSSNSITDPSPPPPHGAVSLGGKVGDVLV